MAALWCERSSDGLVVAMKKQSSRARGAARSSKSPELKGSELEGPELKGSELKSSEPKSPEGADNFIAVVGMSCRLPGARQPAEYWDLLTQGRSAVSGMSDDRWRLLSRSGRQLTPADERVVRTGAFIDGVDTFDAAFFGITPWEAALMDPQQRIMLELGWQAFEDAGTPVGAARGQVGVFVGAASSDYAALVHQLGPDAVAAQSMTGLHRSMVANRVSHHLGLRGPSLVVDTGQSSSLVAVHVACRSLLTGESDLALAAGVQLNLTAESALLAARMGALSADGRCFTFDARANGFVRGEGGAAVVLKRADDAVRDGDRIYCLIAGSATTNDGGGPLTTPSRTAQEEVLRLAHRNAGVTPTDIQYVELHGTGTPVGDPIEAAALGAVIGSARPHGNALWTGSAKTNLGHLEAAAGIAGFVKTALSLHHGQVVPSLNFAEPNPDIPLDGLNLKVATELAPWPDDARPRTAGVSSFGIGGTNCHVVLQEWPAVDALSAPDTETETDDDHVLLLSAHDPAALRERAADLATWLAEHPRVTPGRLAPTLAHSRSHLPHRAVISAADAEAAVARLHDLAAGTPATDIVTGTAGGPAEPRGIAFVFPGQGAQWQGMGRDLIATSPTFAATIAACEQALAPLVDWSLTSVLTGGADAPSLDRVDVVQPASFCVMVALAALWQAHGIHPGAVIGHSQGEIAAAHVAGALSLTDALRIVTFRSRALTTLAGSGAMATVRLDGDTVRRLTAEHGGTITVAALNGPGSTVVSGSPEAVDALLARCEADGVWARRIAVDYASHSPHVDQVADALARDLTDVAPRTAPVTLVSTVTGTAIDTGTMDADYWFRNLRQPVRFAAATRSLLDEGFTHFVEISSHPVLTPSLQETIEAAELPEPAFALATLKREEGDLRRWRTALAQAHAHGLPVDWSTVIGAPAEPLDLPAYPFQRQPYWIDGTAGTHDASTAAAHVAARPEAAQRLLAMPPKRRTAELVTLVLQHAAVVSTKPVATDTDPARTFRDLGLDSLGAVELRNQLAAATGLTLATNLLFNHPSPEALAHFLNDELTKGLDDLVAPARPSELSRTSSKGRGPSDPDTHDDAIAIVGLGCRLPGGVTSPEGLWSVLVEGRDVVSG
ncbi:acyltransferase domain-containing protein, partial [Streptomyces sp. NPDC047315]|uniref:type I polyketide synthase n=1 Tax=Streptomyces sp. NPDC047315 TaxID=3155142 RepID=UPI0033CA3BA1